MTTTQGGSRRPDLAAVAMLLPSLVFGPLSFALLYVVGLVAAALTPVPALVVPVLWLVGLPVVLSRRGEAFYARRVLKLRPPTPYELSVFGPAWQSVCARAGGDGTRQSLWIDPSAGINAHAAGRSAISVTSDALALPSPMLYALLAHELGHSQRGHAPAAVTNQYIIYPALRSLRVLSRNVWLRPLVNALHHVVQLLVAPWNRRAELAADRYAAQLGLGDELVQTLTLFERIGMDGSSHGSWVTRRKASHPSLTRRIARLSGHTR